MNLYQKLFGMNLMRPEDGGESSSGGGTVDRGDDFAATDNDAGKTATDESEDQLEKDVKVATGEDEKDDEDDEKPARDAQGKFTKKDRDDTATIPKNRFDSAVQKERERAEAAERRLAEIERAQQQVTRNADISKLETEVKDLRAQERKALIAGDDEKAAELGSKADALNRQIAIEQARDMSAAAKEQAREEIRMELVIERIETEYPQLDGNSEEFDQDLTDDVLDKQRGYIERERLSPSKALLKAVKYVMSRAAAPAQQADDQPKGLRQADKGADRKEAAVAKNIDASNRQPASSKKVGADSDKFGQNKQLPEADNMTYDEFSALPESTKAKMRGDFV